MVKLYPPGVTPETFCGDCGHQNPCDPDVYPGQGICDYYETRTFTGSMTAKTTCLRPPYTPPRHISSKKPSKPPAW